MSLRAHINDEAEWSWLPLRRNIAKYLHPPRVIHGAESWQPLFSTKSRVTATPILFLLLLAHARRISAFVEQTASISRYKTSTGCLASRHVRRVRPRVPVFPRVALFPPGPTSPCQGFHHNPMPAPDLECSNPLVVTRSKVGMSYDSPGFGSVI